MTASTNARSFSAIFFDFDGTLADSYPAITASVNHVRARHGLAPLPEAEVRRHVGHGPDHLLAQTVPGVDPLAAVEHYRAHHPSVMVEGTRLLPGVAEALGVAHGLGVRLGVCSNKPVDFTRALLAHFRLAEMLDVVLGPEDVPRPKPAPDMLDAALRQLRLAPAEALYVGDMGVDIQTARAAGVAVWVVPTGSDTVAALQAAGPDRLLNDFDELARLVRAWQPLR
jgi:phosphoglycolate phosphatase